MECEVKLFLCIVRRSTQHGHAESWDSARQLPVVFWVLVQQEVRRLFEIGEAMEKWVGLRSGETRGRASPSFEDKRLKVTSDVTTFIEEYMVDKHVPCKVMEGGILAANT